MDYAVLSIVIICIIGLLTSRISAYLKGILLFAICAYAYSYYNIYKASPETKHQEKLQLHNTNKGNKTNHKRLQERVDKDYNKEYFDPQLWTLRTNPTYHGRYKHLELRNNGQLLLQLKRVSRLGRRFGMSAFMDRTMACLDDFFRRYHWGILVISAKHRRNVRGQDIERMILTLQDLRTVALNSMQDITFRIPQAFDQRVKEATQAVTEETTFCLINLMSKVRRQGNSVDTARMQVAENMCTGPVAIDVKNDHSYNLYGSGIMT